MSEQVNNVIDFSAFKLNRYKESLKKEPLLNLVHTIADVQLELSVVGRYTPKIIEKSVPILEELKSRNIPNEIKDMCNILIQDMGKYRT